MILFLYRSVCKCEETTYRSNSESSKGADVLDKFNDFGIFKIKRFVFRIRKNKEFNVSPIFIDLFCSIHFLN